MIPFWNRKEISMGFSMESFYALRQKLEDNDIKYDYRLASNSSSSFWGTGGGFMGTIGENVKFSTTYYLYVHKKDYEYACAVLRSL